MNITKERERLIIARDEMNETIAAIDRVLQYTGARDGVKQGAKRGRPPLTAAAGKPASGATGVHNTQRGFWDQAILAAIREGASTHTEVWEALVRDHQLDQSRKAGFYAAMTKLLKAHKVKKSPTGVLKLANPETTRINSERNRGSKIEAGHDAKHQAHESKGAD
jgi:hypothetical protein